MARKKTAYDEAIVGGITPPGELVFPKLREPDTKFDPLGYYSTKLALDADAAQPLIEQLDGLVEVALAIAREEAANPAAKKKVKATDSLPYQPELDRETGEETGRVLLNFKQRAAFVRNEKTIELPAPPVFDAQRQPLPDDVEVWGGSTGKVAFEARPFYTGALGAGVSLRLTGVQVLDLRTRRPRTADALGFSEEEGYVARGSAADEEDGGGSGAPAAPPASPL